VETVSGTPNGANKVKQLHTAQAPNTEPAKQLKKISSKTIEYSVPVSSIRP
jgi:hypothetical protein